MQIIELFLNLAFCFQKFFILVLKNGILDRDVTKMALVMATWSTCCCYKQQEV